jgi:phospholipid/cholesterol/gamma-HCH transport system substrate-binding protein
MISADAKQIVAAVRQGQGAAGKLLMDEKTAQDVTTIVSNAKQTTANIDNASAKASSMVADIQQNDVPKVDQTLTNVEDMTGQLQGAVTSFLSKGNSQEGTPEALRDTVQHANQAAGNLADDTEALKHNFFFRGFFKRRGFYNLAHMTPSQYEDSRFIKKPASRVWVPAAGLFETGPDGTQKLASHAPSILDEAMSDLVQYLPNNPVMVEAYSSSGSSDERYVSSEQRAEEVRQYLESRFHLNSKWTGTIAFEDKPPKHSGKTRWNGISIVVVEAQ